MTMFMRLLRDAAQRHGLCILVGFPFLFLFPISHHLGSREASPLLMRACLPGAERRGGGSPGPRPVLYVLERRYAVACAPTGAGPRITDRGGASLTHMGALAAFFFFPRHCECVDGLLLLQGDRAALHVSDKTWNAAGRLVSFIRAHLTVSIDCIEHRSSSSNNAPQLVNVVSGYSCPGS